MAGLDQPVFVLGGSLPVGAALPPQAETLSSHSLLHPRDHPTAWSPGRTQCPRSTLGHCSMSRITPHTTPEYEEKCPAPQWQEPLRVNVTLGAWTSLRSEKQESGSPGGSSFGGKFECQTYVCSATHRLSEALTYIIGPFSWAQAWHRVGMSHSHCQLDSSRDGGALLGPA